MTLLRQRMILDLTVRGLAENTRKSYLQAVTGLAPGQICSPVRYAQAFAQVFFDIRR